MDGCSFAAVVHLSDNDVDLELAAYGIGLPISRFDRGVDMGKTAIISSDGHVAAPLEGYRAYLESRYHAALDDVLSQESARMTVNFFDVLDEEIARSYKELMYDSGVINGRFDVHRRVCDAASDGIVGEILFPDGAPFGAGGLGSARNRYPKDQEMAGARAYNRWLVDYVSPYPERFAGQAIIPLADIDAAVKETYWAAEHGMKGVVMPGMDADLPLFWDPCYQAFWSACEETGLVINFHGGIGQPDYGGQHLPNVPDFVRMRISQFEFPWFAHRPLWFLIWAGVLERHPGLRVAFTEQHSDWVIRNIARMDHSWHNSIMDRSIRKIVPRPPSTYFDRQVYLGCSVMSQGELVSRDQIGIERMMYGSDFPHPEGSWGVNLKYLQATVGRTDMSRDEVHAFLYQNAAGLFGFDLEKLRPLIDEHGWDVDEVRTPLPSSESGPLIRKDALRPTVRLTPIVRY